MNMNYRICWAALLDLSSLLFLHVFLKELKHQFFVKRAFSCRPVALVVDAAEVAAEFFSSCRWQQLRMGRMCWLIRAEMKGC